MPIEDCQKATLPVKSGLIYCLFLLISCIQTAAGQYENLRFPQDNEDIKRIKALKISREEKATIVEGKPTLALTCFYNPDGRITRKVTPTNHYIYEYDAKGRIISYIDSAMADDPEDIFRGNYEFEYDKRGFISFSRLLNYSSSYKYDEKLKKLQESTLTDFDTYRKRYYFYDAANHLIREEWHFPAGNLEKIRYITLNKNGQTEREIILKFFENGNRDSQQVNYVYNAANKLLSKSTITRSTSIPEGFDSLPLVTTSEWDTMTYAYAYDEKGNRNVEAFTYSLPNLDHRYHWKFNDVGLKTEEKYYDFTGNLVHTYFYRYKFRK